MAKRIVFSTATPNDQGGVIPSDVIDFSRFNRNPVVLNEHMWGKDPIGLWTDIKIENGRYSGVPVFHGLTEDSKTKKALYDGGWIRAASIGGQAVWEEDATGRYKLDADGNRICKKFYLYEISIVTLPSNEDAVQEDAVELHAKIYEANELENVSRSIETLCSKFNSSQMITKKDFDKLSAEEKKAKIAEMKAIIADVDAEEATKVEAKDTLAAISQEPGLPKWLKEIISLGGVIKFGSEKSTNDATAPTPKETPESKQQTDKNLPETQPTPIGLKAKAAEKAKAEMEKAQEAAEKAANTYKKAKEKADKEGASEEDKNAAESAKADADEAMKACEAAEAAYEKAQKKADKEAEKEDDDEEEEDDKKSKNSAKEKSTNSASMSKPQLKTSAEIKKDLNLAADPKPAKVVGFTGKTFTELHASKDENDKKLLGRVLTQGGGGKEIAEYAAVLNSIIADNKLAAIVEKTRIMANVSERQLQSYQRNPDQRAGLSLKQIAATLNAGYTDMMGRDNVMRTITALSSTDDALASPALNTIEWLSLAIFKLFPNTSWKNDIPLFSAQVTGKNTGIIWPNIAADPAIYRGTQPNNPADYTYSDDAVSLSLTPYWMQPMLWTPLTMHQLRYDQMGTGWAQAFAKWNSVIDDNLIYTLAAAVPASSILMTSGISGYQTSPQSFTISGATDPNAFVWNPAFTGSLKAPVLNDIIAIEQIYNKQNFDLAQQRSTLVVDPTMEAYMAKDPETKSLLTRWVNSDGGEFTKFKNTIMPQRSRVAIYDPATGQVKDPNGVIPSTAISAALGFLPSQVGMGLGMLDVFMIQDPSAYGYRMSADIRIGINWLRKNQNGGSLLTYAPANV